MCLLVTIGRLKEHFYVAINSSVSKTELHTFFRGIFGWSKNNTNEVRRGTTRAMEGKDARRGKGKAKEVEASAKVETQKCSLSLSNI